MIGLAVQLRSSTARPAAAPSAAVLALAAQGKAPASWNRYAASLLRWEEYAARAGTPFLPADPSHFANFLSSPYPSWHMSPRPRGTTRCGMSARACAARS